MHPIDAFRRRPGLDLSSLARTSADADVDELIRITLDGKDGIAVVENGGIVGVVTPRKLLQGVKGKEPGERPPWRRGPGSRGSIEPWTSRT